MFQNNLSEIFSYAAKQKFCIETIGGLNEECMNQKMMIQIPIQIRMTLISIVASYVIITIISNYFFSYGYKSFIDMNSNSEIKIIKDFSFNLMDANKRMKMQLWIMQRLEIIMIGGLLLCIVYLA